MYLSLAPTKLTKFSVWILVRCQSLSLFHLFIVKCHCFLWLQVTGITWKCFACLFLAMRVICIWGFIIIIENMYIKCPCGIRKLWPMGHHLSCCFAIMKVYREWYHECNIFFLRMAFPWVMFISCYCIVLH